MFFLHCFLYWQSSGTSLTPSSCSLFRSPFWVRRLSLPFEKSALLSWSVQRGPRGVWRTMAHYVYSPHAVHQVTFGALSASPIQSTTHLSKARHWLVARFTTFQGHVRYTCFCSIVRFALIKTWCGRKSVPFPLFTTHNHDSKTIRNKPKNGVKVIQYNSMIINTDLLSSPHPWSHP